jgi:phosphoribosylaminoimidazolecarboxamide formyltransferase / IMP cyclohydrolase
MNAKSLRTPYRSRREDPFPRRLRISLGEDSFDTELYYEKVEWTVDGEKRGLRYGENPHQEAALYRLLNGNLVIGAIAYIEPDRGLLTEAELLHAGKHPGKINITDVDSALGILKYLHDEPACVIVKHNNPCGVSQKSELIESYLSAFEADSVAAFGGAVVCNREIDRQTAEEIASRYTEIIAAPDYAAGALEILSKRKNLRVLKIGRIDELSRYRFSPYLDIDSLMDGGLILQRSHETKIIEPDDLLPAKAVHEGKSYACRRKPDERELEDLLFGWRVETGVTSNSVLYVKNKTTVGIGTGEQDRVGVARIARDKALERSETGLAGAVMVSDGFFPFRDGVETGLKAGVTAVIQPGGSVRDWEVIEACNEYGAAMVFTGERSFSH